MVSLFLVSRKRTAKIVVIGHFFCDIKLFYRYKSMAKELKSLRAQNIKKCWNMNTYISD